MPCLAQGRRAPGLHVRAPAQSTGGGQGRKRRRSAPWNVSEHLPEKCRESVELRDIARVCLGDVQTKGVVQCSLDS